MSAFKKGDRVKHPEYGEGTIVTLDESGDNELPGVMFDKSNSFLHTLDGACGYLRGYWCHPDHLTLIAPAKDANQPLIKLPLVDNAAPDNTNPDHYKRGGTETIDYLQAKMSEEEFKGFCRGNALKYISRAPDKNGDEDYRKAIWYLRMLVGDDPRKA